MAHYPFRNGCRGCEKHGDQSCETLDFSRMPIRRRDGDDVAVRCTEYVQRNDNGTSLHAKRKP